MSHAVWKYLQASFEPSYSYVQAFHGDFGQATEHALVLSSPGDFRAPEVVFKGDFVVENGAVTAGTVTGFDIYEDFVKVVKAKGYSFSFDALKDAVDAAHAFNVTPADLLIAEKTIHRGSSHDDPLFGNDDSHSADRFIGKDGKDTLEGGLGSDALKGGAGDDNLWMWHGHDRAVGGPGHDTFVFRDELGRIDVDKVKDFHPGEDVMRFGALAFNVLTPGELQASEFHVGKHAEDSDDYIVYRKAKGALYLDRDGAGGEDQILFAKVDKGLALTHSDFLFEVLG